MTRSELIETLAATFRTLTTADVSESVRVILGAMGDTLENGERIEIRGFGAFSTNLRSPRVGRNPKTGESVEVPAKRAIHFKPGLELRERVTMGLQGPLAASSASNSDTERTLPSSWCCRAPQSRP